MMTSNSLNRWYVYVYTAFLTRRDLSAIRTSRTLSLRNPWHRSCVKMRLACLLRTVVMLSCITARTREVLNSDLIAATLQDDVEDIPDKKRAIYYAVAELAVRSTFFKPEVYANSRPRESRSRSSCILCCQRIFSNSILPISLLNTTMISPGKN